MNTRILAFCALTFLLFACNNEPKLNQQEEEAVENQVAKDQAAMDSLEKAIQAQLGNEENDSDLVQP